MTLYDESDLRVDCALPHLARTDVKVAIRKRQKSITNYMRSLNDEISAEKTDALNAE